MSNFYNELKKDYCANTYLQKIYIPITVKRKYRKKKPVNFFAEVSSIYKSYSKARKKLAGKKSPRMMLRLHYIFVLRIFCAAVFCVSFLLTQYLPAFAGAISVPREARITAENAKTAAQAVIDAEQAVLDRLNAEEYVEDAVALVSFVEEKVRESQAALLEKRQEFQNLQTQAQAKDKEAEAAANKAAKARAKAQMTWDDAKRASEYAQAIDEGTKIRLDEIAKSAADKLDELDNSQEEVSEKLLREVASKALLEIAKIQDETAEVITAAYEKADRLYEIADIVEAEKERLETIASNKAEEADLARDLAEQAKYEVISAQEMYDSWLANLYEARGDEQSAKDDLARLIHDQNQSYSSRYASLGANYYSWSSDSPSGDSGHQIVTPIYYGYSQKEYSYGFSAKFINTGKNSSDATSDGSFSAVSDLAVSVDKRTENEKYIFNYGMDVSLPTGKATLNQKEQAAVTTEDLVEIGHPGKGWQITPKFAVSKKINKEDSLIFLTSYSFNGSYDPTGYIADDTLTPGGEWKKHLRWQHAGQDSQFVGDLIHTSSGSTKVSNGSTYPGGAYWEQRLTYNRKLNETQDLMFYYWRESSSTNADVPVSSSEAANNYYGTMWSKKLDDKRVVRLTFDVMKSNGTHFSHMRTFNDVYSQPQYTSVSVDRRTKYTLGAIYDYKINETSSISAEVQTFKMKDGWSTAGTPPATYKGANIFVMYNRSF